MFSATRRWLRRNRTPIAIGAAVVGGGYIVAKYAIDKINDARERAQLDKIAKDKSATPLTLLSLIDRHAASEDDSSRTR